MEGLSIDEQEERINRNEKIAKETKRLKKAITKEGYEFKPLWQVNKAKIDFSVLKEEVDIEDFLREDYKIMWISMSILLSHMPSVYKNAFVKNKLWSNRNEDKITKALLFWEEKRKMIPPILKLNSTSTELIPHDGKHRIAICHYFDVAEIPIIISNAIIDDLPQEFLEKAR